MSKLMVLRYSKKPQYAFHPRLTLESSGYCPSGHWCGIMFKPGISCGLKTIHEAPTVTEAVAHYFAELKRCNHVEVTA